MNEQFLIDVGVKWDRVPDRGVYPFNLSAVGGIREPLRFHPEVTFFIGENGSGKSTLLEAIAVALRLNPEGGSRNFNFQTTDTHSDLFKFLRLGKGIFQPNDFFFLRAESFYNVSTEIDRLGAIDSYGGVSLHQQSHGEAFMALALHRLRSRGLYLLDEPEAALSPLRQMALLRRIGELASVVSQFVIATHSPILMAYPNSTIYEFCETGIQQVVYEDTDHYKVTRNFLMDHKRMLRRLFDEEAPANSNDE